MRPRVGGYWFGPSMSALAAALRMDRGPSSSGNPCPKLTAPCSTASADMTVKIVVPMPAKTGLKRGFVGSDAMIFALSDRPPLGNALQHQAALLPIHSA